MSYISTNIEAQVHNIEFANGDKRKHATLAYWTEVDPFEDVLDNPVHHLTDAIRNTFGHPPIAFIYTITRIHSEEIHEDEDDYEEA